MLAVLIILCPISSARGFWTNKKELKHIFSRELCHPVFPQKKNHDSPEEPISTYPVFHSQIDDSAARTRDRAPVDTPKKLREIMFNPRGSFHG